MQRYGKFFPIRQEEPYKDRQGNWKEAWPHYITGNGKTLMLSRTIFVKKPRKRDEKTLGLKECKTWPKIKRW